MAPRPKTCETCGMRLCKDPISGKVLALMDQDAPGKNQVSYVPADCNLTNGQCLAVRLGLQPSALLISTS